MDTPTPLSRTALDQLKAVRELSLRGVGGERANARAILRRKLEAHGLTEGALESALGGIAPAQVEAEILPAVIRAVYVSGAVVVKIHAGPQSGVVRSGACGVMVRAGAVYLAGEGEVVLTLARPFRWLYASGAGDVSVAGFSFQDVGLHLSGAGGLIVTGQAGHAALVHAGAGALDAARFAVTSLKVNAAGAGSLRACGQSACISAAGRAVVHVAATRSATVTAGAGARVTVSGCPVAGRRPSPASMGRIHWR